METQDPTQFRSDSSTDPNNNLPTSLKGYSLRPRAARKCDDPDPPVEPEVWRPPRRRKQKSMPLSKYRRKTANARERSRMREINEAFEALRRAIPQMASRECSSEKLTKITTLRLAMRYISALDNILHDPELLESDGESLLSDYTLTPPELSVTADFFTPLLTSDLMHLTDPPGYPETPLVPGDTCLPPLDPVFTHSSYVFDDSQFLTEFS